MSIQNYVELSADEIKDIEKMTELEKENARLRAQVEHKNQEIKQLINTQHRLANELNSYKYPKRD